MRLSIKAKQVAGVRRWCRHRRAAERVSPGDAGPHAASQETQSRGEMLARASSSARPRSCRRRANRTPRCSATAASARSWSRASATRSNVIYAAIVNRDGTAVAHSSPRSEGQPLPGRQRLRRSSTAVPLAAAPGGLSPTDARFEVREPLLARRPAVRRDPRRHVDAADRHDLKMR